MNSQPPRARPAASELRVIHARDGVAVGGVGRVCVTIWRGAVTPVSFEWQRSGLAEVAAVHPEGVAFLCVIERTAKPPRDELRWASVEMLASHGTHLKCVAVVIEGEGFGAAIARGVISGMAHLRSRQNPADSFPNVRSALRWMDKYVPVEPDARVLTARIDELRILLDEK